MANNRMYLTHLPSGLSVFIAKTMMHGWYRVPENLGQMVAELFNRASDEYSDIGNAADYRLVFEDDPHDHLQAEGGESDGGLLRLELGGWFDGKRVTITGPGGTYEHPAPAREAPPKGTRYFVPSLTSIYMSEGRVWDDDPDDYQVLQWGFCHLEPLNAKLQLLAWINANGGITE